MSEPGTFNSYHRPHAPLEHAYSYEEVFYESTESNTPQPMQHEIDPTTSALQETNRSDQERTKVAYIGAAAAQLVYQRLSKRADGGDEAARQILERGMPAAKQDVTQTDLDLAA